MANVYRDDERRSDPERGVFYPPTDYSGQPTRHRRSERYAKPARFQADVDDPDEYDILEPPPHKKRWWIWVLLILLVIVLLVLGWLYRNEIVELLDGKVASAQVLMPTEPPMVTQAPVMPTVPPTSEPTLVPSEVPTALPTEVPTQVPTPEPTAVPTAAPTKAPTSEPTTVPTEVPTPEPTPVPTPEPPKHATYTEAGTISFKLGSKTVVRPRLVYGGGYFPDDDPWWSELLKEAEGSYGPSLEGESIEDGIFNWLHELVKSPLQIVRLRVQLGVEDLDSLEAETARAWEIVSRGSDYYDVIANETLQFFYDGLEGGWAVTSTDWVLENYMADSQIVAAPMKVLGRRNSDDDKIREEKDALVTFYRKDGKKLISARRGLINTAKSAKVDAGDYDNLAWVNLTEGGTWKWKRAEPIVTQAPPTEAPPTQAPPTQAPPTQAPPPRPTKNPEDRLTPTEAPVGGGPTDPENSEDPHTVVAPPTSTPYVPPPVTPAPTPAPTPVPTAVVRPTEVCATAAPTPIHEDIATQPPAVKHTVAPQDAQIVNDADATEDFDPDSI
ncbi:PT domain-containing protein [Candidatus Saccharibacteria bacterium]|nr:PT domain-containing protein [Candidatus Saccharibacteria bacterium]